MVIDFFNNIFDDSLAKVDTKVDNTSAKVDNTSAKVDDASAKVDVTTAKVESTSAKIDILDKKVDTLINSKSCGPSNLNTLNNKINDVSPYKEANVTADGFCYIGYDNGQRECVDVYAGDICMSGEIFPSLDICINPKMRK
jgi:archaellum component FlaC